MRKDAGKDADADSVDATWRIFSSSLRLCARQDCFVFERPQVVFYCKFSSFVICFYEDIYYYLFYLDLFYLSKSANLIGWIVFDAARQTKKTNPRRFFLMTLLRVPFFASVCTLTLAPFV